MSIYSILAVFITVAALAAFVNYRFFKLPMSIGLMAIALGASVLMLILGAFGVDIRGAVERFLEQMSFSETLMKGMLSFLLFAGALNININDLYKQKFIIGGLATLGVLLSTFIVGTGLYAILTTFQLHIPYVYCLLFGALISPTDPIAVLAILRTVNAPTSLATKIAGESLFNDGVGVVIFTVISGIAVGGHAISAGEIGLLFVEEALGGAAFGLLIGWLCYRLLKQVDNYSVEILLTLALVGGGYALASEVHVSGPIAIVVAGLFIGNEGRQLAMSHTTREHLDTFWELIDQILNAILFVWIGLEILILPFGWQTLLVGGMAIILVLGARLIGVASAVKILRFRRTFSKNAVIIMTWGGLRGGISIALALSLATGPIRDLVVSVTYVVVVFSILVQGLTIKRLVSRTFAKST